MTFYNGSFARFCASSTIIAAILVCASFTVVIGQERSGDRDNPTPLQSNKVSDELDGSDSQYFYKFTAGPGKLTVTLEVKASGTNAGAMLDLFASSKPILSNVLVQGVDGGSDRQVNSVQLNGKREIVVRIKGLKYGDSGGTGAYTITLDGPIALAQGAAPELAPAAADPAPAPGPADPAPAPAAPNAGEPAAPVGPNSASGQLNPEVDRKQISHQWNVAAPGVVTFNFSVKAIDKNAGATFVILDGRGIPILSPFQVQGVPGGAGTFSRAIPFPAAQTITVLLQSIAYGPNNGQGTYSVQVIGPVAPVKR